MVNATHDTSSNTPGIPVMAAWPRLPVKYTLISAVTFTCVLHLTTCCVCQPPAACRLCCVHPGLLHLHTRCCVELSCTAVHLFQPRLCASQNWTNSLH
jgi:hypothetical protein